MTFILQWIDVIWLPIAWFVVNKDQRWWSIALVGSCMLMMRMQVELMVKIGYPHGMLPFYDAHVFARGVITYSIFYVAFILLAHYSPNTKGALFMTGTISIFFLALLFSTLVMLA